MPLYPSPSPSTAAYLARRRQANARLARIPGLGLRGVGDATCPSYQQLAGITDPSDPCQSGLSLLPCYPGTFTGPLPPGAVYCDMPTGLPETIAPTGKTAAPSWLVPAGIAAGVLVLLSLMGGRR